MENVIPVKKDRFGEYEELLIKRDSLYKKAESIRINYFNEYGELLVAVYKAKIDCIVKKKRISYYQKSINQGTAIDIALINSQIEKEMQTYYDDLNDMVNNNISANEAKFFPSQVVERVKKIYRKLAKRLHPDMYPDVLDDEKMAKLWRRIVIAYNANDVFELENLEILVARELGDETGDIPLSLSDIEDKIKRVEREISEIISTEPYCFKEILTDDTKRKEYKVMLENELKEHQEYAASLDETIEKMLIESGVNAIWRMK